MLELQEEDPQNYNYSLKFIIIGDISVGKTSIIYHFSKGVPPDNLQATIGVDYFSKTVKIDNGRFRLELWDCSGEIDYLSLTRSICNGCVCALIVFDLTKQKTFENASNWIQEFKRYSTKNEKVIMRLIGNKCDLENRKVNKDQAEHLADIHKIRFYETSAFTGKNIHEVFEDTVKRIARRIDKGHYDLNDEDYGIRLYKKIEGNNGKIMFDDKDDSEDDDENNNDSDDKEKGNDCSSPCRCTIL